jgi:glycosyl transferase family 25
MYLYNFILILLIFISITLQLKVQNIQENFQTESLSISVYVINLDRNKERYDLFMENYNKLMPEIPIERISAIDGNTLSYKELEDIVSPDVLNGIKHIDNTGERLSLKQLTRGMIGCYLSHIKIYENNINQSNLVLIFEDDAKFDINIHDFIKDLKNIPDDWDIILLGTVQIFNYTDINQESSFKRVNKFWGTQGYLINNSGIQKMLKYYKPINNQIDFIMGELSTNNLLNVYAYKDNIIYQSSIYSDVQMLVKK